VLSATQPKVIQFVPKLKQRPSLIRLVVAGCPDVNATSNLLLATSSVDFFMLAAGAFLLDFAGMLFNHYFVFVELFSVSTFFLFCFSVGSLTLVPYD
jgi:hypothetical protein